MEEPMSEDLVFYTNPMSRGRIVRWMLEEVGQPYRTELLNWGENREPAFLAVNPMGKVPTIKHGETVVTEGAAICAYLADAFPQAGLAPPLGDHRRGPYFRWLFFAAGPVEAAVTNRTLGVEVSPEQTRMVGYGNYAAVMDTIEHALSQSDFLTGDTFTAADVYFGAQMGWGLQMSTIEPRPAVQRYVERVTARPAFKRASEIDDKLIAEQHAAAG